MKAGTEILTRPGNELHLPRVENIAMLFFWITAAVAIVLPFALGTSPLDAILLRVPNNEGNWWHALVGLPFFLSLPMVSLRLHIFNSTNRYSFILQRIFWSFILISAAGTLLVETPFLLHRAGTSELQRLGVIFSGIGILLINGIFLFTRRKKIHATRSLFIGINAAYLANAFLCLIVYGEAKFRDQSRSGWWATLVVVVPILIDLIWLLSIKTDETRYK